MTGEISAPGLPDLYAESLLNLTGFAADADGAYLAKRVTHTFSDVGYVTDISAETAGDVGAEVD